MNYCIIKTTFSSKKEAEFLAKLLIERKLAGCSQISKVESFYYFDDKIEQEDEYLLAIKTKKKNYQKIEKLILENHSYNCPQILAIPIEMASENYLKWIDKVTI